jgi:ATP-dependent DNA helicase RecQ
VIENAVEQRAQQLLNDIAGRPVEFRPGQWEAISEIVERSGRALVVQRTGWGKSAVYLIATRLIRERGGGPTLIVSPLLALMRNQIEMAERAGVQAATVNSTNRDRWDEIADRAIGGDIDLLLISPERLNNQAFLESTFPSFVNHMGLLVVDEVHCISDWGHDFRPDYRRLSQVVQSLPASVPVLGTTATANDRVVSDVAGQLGANLTIQRGTLERESLSLQVLDLPRQTDRMAWLAQHVPKIEGSGIVYCLTITDAYRVGRWLKSQGIEVEVYTGATDPDVRLGIESRLTAGDLDVVVATSALGMGYDNPHITFVIHFQSPGSPIAYYQQVGRAGRAVGYSVGVLMSGAEDTDIQDYFIDSAFPSERLTDAVIGSLREAPKKLTELEREVNLGRGRLTGLLKILEVEGAILKDGSLWRRSDVSWSYPAERVGQVTEQRRHEQAAMQEYTETGECLMRFLRRELDDSTADDCGRCANCLGRPVVPIEIDPALSDAALAFMGRTSIVIEPRKRWPVGVKWGSLSQLGNEEGRALAYRGDPGAGAAAAQAIRQGIGFPAPLVEQLATLVEQWDPEVRPAWVTAVPNSGESDRTSDFAARLAERIGLPFAPAVVRVAERPPQSEMYNSAQQLANVRGAFEVLDPLPGPVLLVDDLVSSRWTITAIGHLLRTAGVEAVLPVALLDASRGGV